MGGRCDRKELLIQACVSPTHASLVKTCKGCEKEQVIYIKLKEDVNFHVRRSSKYPSGDSGLWRHWRSLHQAKLRPALPVVSG